MRPLPVTLCVERRLVFPVCMLRLLHTIDIFFFRRRIFFQTSIALVNTSETVLTNNLLFPLCFSKRKRYVGSSCPEVPAVCSSVTSSNIRFGVYLHAAVYTQLLYYKIRSIVELRSYGVHYIDVWPYTMSACYYLKFLISPNGCTARIGKKLVCRNS